MLAESYAAGDYDRFIIDGVTGKVAGHQETIAADAGNITELPTIEFGKLSVDFHRCPECGMDLPARQSLIYRCDNCSQLVNLDSSYPGPVDAKYARPPERPKDKLFPFWSIALAGDQSALIKKHLGGLRQADRLVVPAFRTTAFEGAYRLARRATAALPDFDLCPLDEAAENLQSANASIAEALLLAEVIVYRAAVDRAGDLAGDKPDLKPSHASLIFLPFQPQSYFFVDSVHGAVTFEKRLID
jgi:predicted RNA-binding Zn-ribbon protein involved in translation (DUF1610 family)